MKRRNFLQQTGVVAAAALVSPSLISMKKQPLKLVILHTNDTHSNIDPFPKNHSKFPDKGGVSRRAKLVQTIREQEDHVLLLDAGDVFQGTPYFNKFKGVLEMKVMQEMGYDAMTLGNHDFDIGIEGFVNAKKHATFPIVNCNYDLAQTSLKELVSPSIILKKAGRKIGITGIGIDLNPSFLGNKLVIFAVVDCLYPAMGLDIAPWCLKVLFMSFGMVTTIVASF